MSRISGRNAQFYLGAASTSAAASPLLNQAALTFAASTDKVEVTAFGDSNKTYVAGLPDASGTVSGFYDTASAQSYTAASDGGARKMYFYPDALNNAGTYWFGTVLIDFTLDAGVGDAAKTAATWNAASPIQKVG